MTDRSVEISNEVLRYAGYSHLDASNIAFKGIPIGHNLPFPFDEIAAGVQGALGLLAAEIWKQTTGQEQQVSIDLFHSYLSFSSTLFVRQNGYALSAWDGVYPTVGLYETRDERLIFINGGYPALRDKILKVLDVPNDHLRIAQAMLSREADELEQSFADAGTCAAIVREKNEWLAHPQGAILNANPPIVIKKMSDTKSELLPGGDMPLAGLRVLDLTHVLAGPATGRFLAELGADVLHVSAPHLPFIPFFLLDTSHGKRQAYADLRIPADLDKFKELLSQADVFVEGWRPGSMSKFGLSPEEVQKIRPGLIHLTESCYGIEGPWSDRAGWEQQGQAVSGIIDLNYFMVPDGERMVKTHSDAILTHGLFICDYLTGNFGAIAILASLLRRQKEGGGYHTHLSLARNGMWAISKPPTEGVDVRPLKLPLARQEYEYLLASSKGPYGHVEYLAPPIYLSKTKPRLLLPASPRGSGKLEW